MELINGLISGVIQDEILVPACQEQYDAVPGAILKVLEILCFAIPPEKRISCGRYTTI